MTQPLYLDNHSGPRLVILAINRPSGEWADLRSIVHHHAVFCHSPFPPSLSPARPKNNSWET